MACYIPKNSLTTTKIINYTDKNVSSKSRLLSPDLVYDSFASNIGAQVRVYISKNLSGEPGFEVNGTIAGVYRD